MVYKPDCTHAFHELNRLNFCARAYLAGEAPLEEFRESADGINSEEYINAIIKYINLNNSKLAEEEERLRKKGASCEYETLYSPENFEENLRDIFGKITKLSEGESPDNTGISYNDLLDLQKIIQPVYESVYKNPDYRSTFL